MKDDTFFRGIRGPVGSGKSVASCFEIVRRASSQEPNEQGIRKSRCAVVRETVRQLTDTTIKTFLDWFPPGPCGQFMRTTKTYFFKVGDVECEIMLYLYLLYLYLYLLYLQLYLCLYFLFAVVFIFVLLFLQLYLCLHLLYLQLYLCLYLLYLQLTLFHKG